MCSHSSPSATGPHCLMVFIVMTFLNVNVLKYVMCMLQYLDAAWLLLSAKIKISICYVVLKRWYM